MIYIPKPERHPLLLRRPRWAGGLTLAAVLAAAVLGIPAVYGACALVWELDAVAHPESGR